MQESHVACGNSNTLQTRMTTPSFEWSTESRSAHLYSLPRPLQVPVMDRSGTQWRGWGANDLARASPAPEFHGLRQNNSIANNDFEMIATRHAWTIWTPPSGAEWRPGIEGMDKVPTGTATEWQRTRKRHSRESGVEWKNVAYTGVELLFAS